MSLSAPVPVVIVEEHHEAFYVWHHAISEGWISKSGNTLLHIDEHHDLWRPVLNKSLSSIKTRSDAALFTYQQLGIGSFIWPAVFEGIFSRIVWMRYGWNKDKSVRLWSIWPKDSRELEFFTRFHTEAELPSQPAGSRSIEITTIGPCDYEPPAAPFVLDIDLDYFACNSKPQRRFELEITAGSYDQFKREPYNLLRLPSERIVAERREDRYFLIFNSFKTDELRPVTAASVDERLGHFRAFLSAGGDRPGLVVICRSLYSGYTPKEFATYVQERVLEELSRRFDIECLPLTSILPAETTWSSLVVRE